MDIFSVAQIGNRFAHFMPIYSTPKMPMMLALYGESMIQANFVEEFQLNIDEVEVIDIRKKAVLGHPSYYVLVCIGEKPLYLLRIYLSDETDCFHDLKTSNSSIFIGCGENIHVFSINDRLTKTIKLDGYIGYLYPNHEIESNIVKRNVLVASASKLINLTESGDIVWESEVLGIDGVVVHSISNGLILGCGEYDPPGGWEEFKVDILNGKCI